MDHPTSFLVLSFLIARLFTHTISWGIAGWAFLLLTSEAGVMGVPISYMLISTAPPLLIILSIRSHIFSHLLYPGLVTTYCIALDQLLLQPLIGGLHPDIVYTIAVIFGNMMITTLFFLKLKTGKMRQSLMRYTA